jgi:glutamine synthetase
VTDQLEQLPRSLEEAWETAKSSPFIQACLPAQLIEEMEP